MQNYIEGIFISNTSSISTTVLSLSLSLSLSAEVSLCCSPTTDVYKSSGQSFNLEGRITRLGIIKRLHPLKSK